MLLDPTVCTIYVLFVVIVTQKTWKLKGASSIELSDPKKKRKEQINTPFFSVLFSFVVSALLAEVFLPYFFPDCVCYKTNSQSWSRTPKECKTRKTTKKSFFLEGSGDPHETFPVHCASVTGR